MNQCTIDAIHTSAAVQSEHSQVEATVCVLPTADRFAITDVPVGTVSPRTNRHCGVMLKLFYQVKSRGGKRDVERLGSMILRGRTVLTE